MVTPEIESDSERILRSSTAGFFIENARKPRGFKLGDEWHPERSGGNPSLLPDTTGFSPWSGSF
jgi:hypothetical protein